MLSEQYSDRLYSASPLAQQSVEVVQVQQWVEVASNSAGRVALEAQGACTVPRTNRGIPPGGEALLDGAGVHGALDDGVLVVEPEALHLHWRLSWAVIKNIWARSNQQNGLL